MPVPSAITDLSTTAASNSPAGSDNVFPELDNFLRAHASFVALLRDGKGLSTEATLASASTADIGGAASILVQITGTTTITSFGTNYQPRVLRFAGALTLTHNATTLILPTGANITTAAGDMCLAVPVGTSGWRVLVYQRADQAADFVSFLQAGTGATSRTVQSKLRDAITPQDFGAAGDGIADDTIPLQNWANRAGLLFMPAGTYKITAAVSLLSNTKMVAANGAVVQTATTNISLFTATSRSGIQIFGVKFKATASGASAYVGGVKLTSCTDSHISDCVFEGMQWAGVLLDGCSRCIVRGNYFTGWLGTVQDAADVCIYNDCALCEVVDNQCFGGGQHGVLVQDPYAGLLPKKCVVSGNRIGQHTGYGIAVYLTGISGTGDTYNQIVNNYIENIEGSYSTNRSSGSGIYVVGNWTGGTQVIGNNIYNCCVQTLDRTLAPAGIGISNIPSTVTKPVVANNTITGMTQGDGILVVSSPGGAVVANNVIRIPSTNNSTGVGGATLLGSGLRFEASSGVESIGNHVTVLGNGNAFLQYANGVASSDIAVTGGYFESASGATLNVIQNGGFTTSNFIVSGVRAKNTGSSNYAFSIGSVVGGVLTNNIGYAPSFEALRISACTQVRVSGGSYTSGATPAVSTTGTCTGSFIDQTVYWGISPGAMSNSGTGVAVTWRSSAVPASGTWAVGDTTEQSVPAVGSPKRWRCTVAGTSGTWVSEGNL